MASDTTPKTVHLKGDGLDKEAAAIAAITPGDLIEFNSTGVRRHSVAAGNARKAFALEADYVGKGIDDNYAIGDRVLYKVYENGGEVYARVAAAATAITKGAALESAGDGTVRISTAAAATSNLQRDGIVGYALEAVDNSGGGSAVRIRVEVA